VIETIRFWAIVVLLGFGVLFTLVSTVGVIRLPDIYARAHTASQTDTLGAGFALAGVALAFGWQHAAVYTVLLLFFRVHHEPDGGPRDRSLRGGDRCRTRARRRGRAETDETETATETDGEP